MLYCLYVLHVRGCLICSKRRRLQLRNRDNVRHISLGLVSHLPQRYKLKFIAMWKAICSLTSRGADHSAVATSALASEPTAGET